MNTTIVHLIGAPGVGKYTVAVHLADITGATLIDNHSICNPVFMAVGADGMTPLPSGVWPRVSAMRAPVLDTIRNVSPPGMSFIFTNYIAGGSASERTIHDEFVDLAAARGSLYVPVLLRCETPTLLDRVGGESRRRMLKLLDPVLAAHFNAAVPSFVSGHSNELSLDTTATAPEENARQIAAWVAKLSPA